MGTVWAESVRRSLDEAVELLGAVIQVCLDELWGASMWRVHPSEIVGEVYDDNGIALTDSAQKDARIQRWSQPWSVAWHALEVLDYDLAGELTPWTPPPPFAGNPHWQTFTSLPVAWSHSEIAGYVDHCRQRVRDSLGAPSLDIRRNLAEGLWIEEGGAAALCCFTTQITKRNRCSDST